MPTFIAKSLDYSVSKALLASMVCLGTFAVLLPFLGALSDRVGRRPLLLGATIGFVVLSYPLFLLMRDGAYTGVLVAQVALATVVAVFSGPGPAAMAEMFPTTVCYSRLCLGCAAAVPHPQHASSTRLVRRGRGPTSGQEDACG
jgi:MFS transporter, MHS family, proline/betaine transporter